VVVAAVAAVCAGPVLARGEADAPLDRYRPILRYSTQEAFFAQPVSLPPASAEVRPGDRVYGHLAREGDETWLQYWLYYAYNPQDRSPLRTGRHEGDWELVQLRLGADGRPDLATLSQHSWAEGCAWPELELARAGVVDVPVVYVANGSHANYSRPGDYDRPFPDPTDEADGRGREVRPALTPISDRAPAWVAYPGRWGESDAGFVPGESPSPFGPRFQASGAWEAPASYHDELARPCGSGAPGRPWQLPAAVAVLGALLAVVWVSRSRGRRAELRRGRTGRFPGS
jgi:hypothetical protein